MTKGPPTLEWLLERTRATTDGCLEWRGRRSHGYGNVTRRGRFFLAHRLVCELTYGPAPDGKPQALHSCDNPPCINPAHLRWGSHAENMAEMKARGRARSPSRKGESHPRAKITDQDVIDAREMRAAGALTREIGARLGISQAHASKICRGECWGHVT